MRLGFGVRGSGLEEGGRFMVRASEDVRRLRPDRVPPNNLEAEESVLGAMMLYDEAIADVLELMKPDEFYR
jgi:hypothetical protein